MTLAPAKTALDTFRRLTTDRLIILWSLAVLVLAYSVIDISIGYSLFVSMVGAEKLPLIFILVGLGAMPSYLLFSQIVDRYPRPQIFRIALGVAIFLSVGLRFLIQLDQLWIYYLLLILMFFQWDFHITILYTSLLPDYFSATEYKQNMPAIGIGQAIGTLLGGTLTSGLCYMISTPDLLWVSPILMLVAIGVLGLLTPAPHAPQRAEKAAKVHMMEALTSFPALAQKFPLMFFLAGSTLFVIVINLASEFLWLSVYEQHFTHDELTEFLGFMRVVVSIIQIAVLYCITKPLLNWLGVSRMNWVYPMTSLISLSSFLSNINLGTGIGLHLNFDGLQKSINIPVHQLNYNAIPPESMGRIRTLSDGIFYSTGLICVGGLLYWSQNFLTLHQITWILFGLGCALLLLRVPMGQFYSNGLKNMLQEKTIDFTQLPKGSALPTPLSLSLLRNWLTSEQKSHQYLALEMASELDLGHEVWDEMLSVPAAQDEQLRRQLLSVWSNPKHRSLEAKLVQLLSSDWGFHQSMALEALITRKFSFSEERLKSWTHHESSEIQTLAAIAILDQEEETSLTPWAQSHFQQPLCAAGGEALLRMAASRPDSCCTDIIINRLGHSRQFAQKALKTLAQLSTPPPDLSWRLVLPYLQVSDANLRRAAFQYLGLKHPQEAMKYYPLGCCDIDPSVRETVATLIAQSPETGLPFLEQQLTQNDKLTQNTAIAALGKINTKLAHDLLYQHLEPDLNHLKHIQKWQKQMPQKSAWKPLVTALSDYQTRLIQKILFVIGHLGHESTVQAVNHALLNPTGRERANAIELLSSFKERRFTRPLLSLLGQPSSPVDRQSRGDDSPLTWLTKPNTPAQSFSLLESAIKDDDLWIQRGAIATLTQNGGDILSPAETQQLLSVANTHAIQAEKNNPMSQLLLLKQVRIFQNLTLDELQLIAEEMDSFKVLAQQVIYEEGAWGQFFYVITQGHVTLTKEISQQSFILKQLGVGDYLGEVSLFDDSPHWDGAIAAEDSVLLKLEKQKFKSLLMQYPRISLEICRYLSQRLREFENFCGMPNLPIRSQEN